MNLLGPHETLSEGEKKGAGIFCREMGRSHKETSCGSVDWAMSASKHASTTRGVTPTKPTLRCPLSARIASVWDVVRPKY